MVRTLPVNGQAGPRIVARTAGMYKARGALHGTRGAPAALLQRVRDEHDQDWPVGV